MQALAETAAVNPSMSESLQRTAEKAAEGMLGVSRVTLTLLSWLSLTSPPRSHVDR